MIDGAPFEHSAEWFTGLAATNAMTVAGITSSDYLLAVVSYTSAGLVKAHDITDFTVGDGTLTAGTIDLSGQAKCYAIWTPNSPT